MSNYVTIHDPTDPTHDPADTDTDGVVSERERAIAIITPNPDADGASEETVEEKQARETAEYFKRYGVAPDGFDKDGNIIGYQAPGRESYGPYSKMLYSGPSLLDPEGMQRSKNISGNQFPTGIYQELYDVDIDSVKLLQEFDYSYRFKLTDFLYKKGFYGGAKPSATRFDRNDINAVGRLLVLSNQSGRTWDAMLDWAANNLKTILGGPTIGAVTPFENREKVLDTEAVDILGRKLTNAELREAAEMIAQRERSGDKTTLSVMAEKAVSKQNPKLESANRFAKGVDIFRSMLGTG